MPKEQYQVEYNEFIETYEAGTTSGEAVGIIIIRLVQYFAEKNMALGKCDKRYSAVLAKSVDSVDELTGKPMSAAKAEIIAKATEESYSYIAEKIHLQNIEQMINALKALQKGIMNEYSHVGAL